MGTLNGPSHEEGGMPVTDQQTGEETDVSLEGGEIVFSKENSAALKQAVDAGDKDAVFEIVSANMQQEVSEGEMAKGGVYKRSEKMDWSGYGGRKSVGEKSKC